MRIPISVDEPIFALTVIAFCAWRAFVLIRSFWYALKSQKEQIYG